VCKYIYIYMHIYIVYIYIYVLYIYICTYIDRGSPVKVNNLFVRDLSNIV